MPSVVACKRLGTYYFELTLNYDFDLVYVQTTTAQLQSELSVLKTRLEMQESETHKANSKFEFSMVEAEKLIAGFEVEKSAWAEENIALT